jgi:hypothetical protein
VESFLRAKRNISGRIPFPAMGVFLLAAAMTGISIQAQELSLFEQIETQEQQVRPDPRPTPNERAGNGEPEFTLVGTSRIGNKHRAVLRTRSGELVTVQGGPESTVQIPGHAGYRVTSVQPREVSLAYPSGAACMSYEDRGVSCSSASLASLSLTTAAPVQVAEPVAGTNPRGRAARLAEEALQAAAQEAGGDGSEATNPFAAALRAAANESAEDAASRRAEAQRFQMRRIDPSQVPPGQRLVRTPFGDRLIDQ